MAGIKAKISTTIDKLTHKSGNTDHSTGTGSGLGHNTGDMHKTSDTHHHTAGGVGGVGSGYETGRTGELDTTTGSGAGYGTSTGGVGTTGAEYGTTGAGYGTTGAGYGTTTGTVGGASEIIDSETFTKTEDHEVLIEKKRYELEHRPVQKQYVVETRFVGEQAVAGGPTEVVGSETREVEEHVHQAPAGDRTIVVENVDVPAGQRVTGATGGSAY